MLFYLYNDNGGMRMGDCSHQ